MSFTIGLYVYFFVVERGYSEITCSQFRETVKNNYFINQL